MFDIIPLSKNVTSIDNCVSSLLFYKSQLCIEKAYVQVYEADEQYFLITAEASGPLVKTVRQLYKECTREFLSRMVDLLMQSKLHDTLYNAKRYHLFVPDYYLKWLDVDDSTGKLQLDHYPTYISLTQTLMKAANPTDFKAIANIGNSKAQIIVDVPKPINAEQLKCLVSTYAEPLSFKFHWALSNAKNLSPEDELPLKVDLIIRSIEEDVDRSGYEITILDVDSDEIVSELCIDDIMKPLEKSAPPLAFDAPSIKLGHYLREIPCERNASNDVVLHFLPRNNLEEFEFSPDFNIVLDAQLTKIVRKQAEKTHFIPHSATLVHNSDPILHMVRDNAQMLHTVPQTSLAEWLRSADLQVINNAILLLLGKVQNHEPFTLPGSRDIVEAMQCFLYFCLYGKSASIADKKRLAKVVNKTSMLDLRQARFLMKKSLYAQVKEMYLCCLGLSNAHNLPAIRHRLEEKSGIVFSNSMNIAYDPQVTMHMMIRFTEIITKVYCSCSDINSAYTNYKIEGGINRWFRKKLLTKHMLNDGLWLQFMFKGLVDLPHYNRTWFAPTTLIEFSFDMINMKGRDLLSPSTLCLRSLFEDAFYANAIIDSPWKSLLNQRRLQTTIQVEDACASLLESCSFIEVDGKYVTTQNLLAVFELLFYVLTHEYGSENRTRMRILPESLGYDFLTKKHLLFYPFHFELSEDFKHLSVGLFDLLPFNSTNFETYYLASLFFDSIIQCSQDAFYEQANFEPSDAIERFDSNFQNQYEFLTLLASEKNWSMLKEQRILPNYSLNITDMTTKERVALLSFWHYGYFFHFGNISWCLQGERD